MNDGLFKTIQNFLRKRMSPELYDIVEPLLSALTKSAERMEQTIYDLLDQPLPTSIDGFFSWAWNIITGIVGGGWDSVIDIARGIRQMFVNAFGAARKYLNYLISKGKLGVKQSTYSWKTWIGDLFTNTVPDTFKIQIGGINIYKEPQAGDSEANTGVVFGTALFLALKFIGASPTDGDGNFWVDD